MAKILTDGELAEIVRRTVDEYIIDDMDEYGSFLKDIAQVIADHFGGEVGHVAYEPNDGLGWTVSFYPNECLPDDGGIFKDYDPDVTWKDGEEVE